MGSFRVAARPAVKKLVKKVVKTTEDVLFEIGQRVVYPGYGVGQVQSIETKDISGSKVSLYMIKILEKGITLMVPVNQASNYGLRPVATEEDVKKLYTMFKKKEVIVEQSTWNRRHREYMEKIKTGSLFEIGEVVRDLCVLQLDKVLSFGERNMLKLAKGLLVKELSIAESSDEPTIEAQIDEIFAK